MVSFPKEVESLKIEFDLDQMMQIDGGGIDTLEVSPAPDTG